MGSNTNIDLIARLDFIEFRQELLFQDNAVSRLLFEYGIDRNQSKSIIDLMEKYRCLIESGKKVHHHQFEDEIYNISPERKHDYHFVEFLVQGYHQIGAWEEVFETLYGSMPKFQSYMKRLTE